jgi:hypothetical protein
VSVSRVSRQGQLNGRQKRRVVELARLKHPPATIASLLQLPPELVEQAVLEAKARAKISPLRVVLGDGRARQEAGRLPYRPRALKP